MGASTSKETTQKVCPKCPEKFVLNVLNLLNQLLNQLLNKVD